jgi:hypothetical protein
MIPIREVDHLVLRVVDRDAMLRFYVEFKGPPGGGFREGALG